jgi:photosystem II stability/assembly factor-like uncharacterized protein
MKKLIIMILGISLIQQISTSQWIQQVSPVTSGLYDMHFINLNTGWITGTNSVILKTTNSGNNWLQQISPVDGRQLNGIQMIDENTGYIGGWANTFLKTTNSGENWIQLPGPSDNYGSLNAISFINVNTGWACSFLGIIWKTTNGGSTWDSLYTGSGGPLRNVQFLNAQTGWVAGDVGSIRKTTDGGVNWFFQFFGTTADFWYNSLQFLNINTGWVVGYNNRVFRTTDGGNDWDTVSTITGGSVIKFINSNTGWCGGSLPVTNQSVIYKTTNGGFNWLSQILPPSINGFCGDIAIANDTTVWTTFGNRIFHTTNGGTYVGIAPISEEIPVGHSLFQNYPNPFNSETKIKFQIFEKNHVRLSIYDILGKEIGILLNEQILPGLYEVTWNASGFSSGTYFYRLKTVDFDQTKKLIFIK